MNPEKQTNISTEIGGRNIDVESLDCIIMFRKFWVCTCFRSLLYLIVIMASSFNSKHSFNSDITV